MERAWHILIRETLYVSCALFLAARVATFLAFNICYFEKCVCSGCYKAEDMKSDSWVWTRIVAESLILHEPFNCMPLCRALIQPPPPKKKTRLQDS